MTSSRPPVSLHAARPADVPDILRCIRGLAEFERLGHECTATEALLHDSLFGPSPAAEVLLARTDDHETVGFALWFRSYSTFLARPGLHLEDLYVMPHWRGRGVGRLLLAELARMVVSRGYARLEWAVLDWNVDAIRFYRSIGAVMLSDWTTFRVTGDALASLASLDSSRPSATT